MGIDSRVGSEMLDQFVWDIDGYDVASSLSSALTPKVWTGVELPHESVWNRTTKKSSKIPKGARRFYEDKAFEDRKHTNGWRIDRYLHGMRRRRRCSEPVLGNATKWEILTFTVPDTDGFRNSSEIFRLKVWSNSRKNMPAQESNEYNKNAGQSENDETAFVRFYIS